MSLHAPTPNDDPRADVEEHPADEATPLLIGSAPANYSRGQDGGANIDEEGERERLGDDEQTVVVRELSTTRISATLGTVYVGVFLGAIDASIIATLSAPIASEFKSLSLLPWLASAYLIANAACQPISGRLTDIFGRGPGLTLRPRRAPRLRSVRHRALSRGDGAECIILLAHLPAVGDARLAGPRRAAAGRAAVLVRRARPAR